MSIVEMRRDVLTMADTLGYSATVTYSDKEGQYYAQVSEGECAIYDDPLHLVYNSLCAELEYQMMAEEQYDTYDVINDVLTTAEMYGEDATDVAENLLKTFMYHTLYTLVKPLKQEQEMVIEIINLLYEKVTNYDILKVLNTVIEYINKSSLKDGLLFMRVYRCENEKTK